MRRFQWMVAIGLSPLLFCAGLWAQGLPSARPHEVGLSSERLERITQTIEADVKAERIPGALGLVARNGRVAYLDARGWADREKKVKVEHDTIFRIYSMSKPITNVAMMMLYEQGLFRLNDPVAKFIPEMRGLKVAIEPKRGAAVSDGNGDGISLVDAKREMTIRDLMRHTSGLTYGYFGDSKVDKMYLDAGVLASEIDLAEMIRRLSKIPLKHQPGTTWEYSVSVDVQGRLVEVLSGMPFDRYLKENIFDPLKMPDTGFWVPEEKRSRFAQLYRPIDGNREVLKAAEPGQSDRYIRQGGLFSGGGGLVSTAADYVRFCQMLLNGGVLDGKRLLSRKTIDLMTVDHLGEIDNRTPGYGFGLGFAVLTDLAESGYNGSVGEYRWGGAAGTRFWIDPKENLIGIYMVQILPHGGLRYGDTFKILTYQAVAD